MKTWDEVRSELNLSQEDEAYIKLEEELIDAIIKVREEKGLSQKQLADLCNCKQSAIARLETKNHSPQIDSLLKVLIPLGYKLQIVPVDR